MKKNLKLIGDSGALKVGIERMFNPFKTNEPLSPKFALGIIGHIII